MSAFIKAVRCGHLGVNWAKHPSFAQEKAGPEEADSHIKEAMLLEPLRCVPLISQDEPGLWRHFSGRSRPMDGED